MSRPRLAPQLLAAIDRRATELAATATPLTARQIVQLRDLFANPAEGGER